MPDLPPNPVLSPIPFQVDENSNVQATGFKGNHFTPAGGPIPVFGPKGDNQALASLIGALVAAGLIVDQTS